jgi:pyrimidine-nucleoside phosphorylase
MSGRALGFTGGTIDKLESIPGFRTQLTQEEMLAIIREVGCCIVEQSAELVPADKVFYALRDATDTVEEMGLVAASVISKKVACGAPYVLLDVKCGNGAFFKTLGEARSFAALAKRLGAEFGRKVGCVITSMNQPLGDAIGTSAEVSEAERFLRQSTAPEQSRIARGETPWAPPLGRLNDLYEVVVALASCAQVIAGTANNLGEGKLRAAKELEGGKPHQIFHRWIAAQGGIWDEFESTIGGASQSTEDDQEWPYFSHWVMTHEQGYVQSIDTAMLGTILARLGRSETGGEVRHDVNFDLCCRVGDKLDAEGGAVLLDIMMKEDPTFLLEEDVRRAFVIGDVQPEVKPMVLETLL